MSKKEKNPITREPVINNNDEFSVAVREERIKQAENDGRQKQPSRVITSGDKKTSAFMNLPTINIKVFAQISGIKPDQLAGFVYYAKKQNIRNLTRPEWDTAYKEFMSLPVK